DRALCRLDRARMLMRSGYHCRPKCQQDQQARYPLRDRTHHCYPTNLCFESIPKQETKRNESISSGNWGTPSSACQSVIRIPANQPVWSVAKKKKAGRDQELSQTFMILYRVYYIAIWISNNEPHGQGQTKTNSAGQAYSGAGRGSGANSCRGARLFRSLASYERGQRGDEQPDGRASGRAHPQSR